MSTRACIKISDKWDTFYIDRTHDAIPENVLADISAVIEYCKGNWSGSELGLFVGCFFGMVFNPKQRIQDYALSAGPAGDESFSYYVEWCEADKKYICGVLS